MAKIKCKNVINVIVIEIKCSNQIYYRHLQRLIVQMIVGMRTVNFDIFSSPETWLTGELIV